MGGLRSREDPGRSSEGVRGLGFGEVDRSLGSGNRLALQSAPDGHAGTFLGDAQGCLVILGVVARARRAGCAAVGPGSDSRPVVAHEQRSGGLRPLHGRSDSWCDLSPAAEAASGCFPGSVHGRDDGTSRGGGDREPAPCRSRAVPRHDALHGRGVVHRAVGQRRGCEVPGPAGGPRAPGTAGRRGSRWRAPQRDRRRHAERLRRTHQGGADRRGDLPAGRGRRDRRPVWSAHR